jgi:glycosyltransferase involved in cell wall biosynthesis
MNKILEYMAFGKPIVQFELTEGRVSAGDASLYARANDSVDLADKIEALLASPETRERMGAIGVARVADDLSWAHQVPKLLAAYDRLFSR